MPEIDPDLLPVRSLVDSSVVFGAFGSRASGPEVEACRAFFDAMINKGRTILIAAPTVAELLRGSSPVEPPRRKGIVVVGFDDDAARSLASDFPADVLKRCRDETGGPYQYIKYDAMIVACAKRHRADCLVTRDHAMKRLAEHAKLKCKRPDEFYAAQGSLALPITRMKPKLVK